MLFRSVIPRAPRSAETDLLSVAGRVGTLETPPGCKSSLNIWKFMVHILLKPGLEDFEHYFASVCRLWGRTESDTTEVTAGAYTHTHNTHTYNQVEERIISIISEDSGYSFIFLQGFKLILGSVSHRPDLFPS